MNTKTFLNLLIITFLITLFTILSINFNKQTYVFENRGDSFINNFTKNINDIHTISIESFDNTLDLIKQDNSYASKSGYPLKKGIWENLITSLSLLRIEEKKTNDPQRYSELNLLSPELNNSKDESDGYASKITLKKKDGTIYTSILFGKTDPSVGGLSGGQFARMSDEDQSYLLKGAIRMPSSKSDWFESLLFTIQNKDFKSAKLINENKVFEIQSFDKSLKLTYPELDILKIDEIKLNQVREVINGFYFYDVRKSNDNNINKSPTILYETKKGLILSISSISSNKNKESWVIIKANYNNPNAKALSEEINKKTSGFEFLANINTSEILLWNVNNFKSKS
ncbi:DUF4340 domain-containing protein [Alphaproteobacteria bacterium]|nr:DUF4340 domain-containing protein [Alphaproteobacteria bacterium]